MAASLSTAREPVTYTDDFGNVWRVEAQSAIFSQGKQGGASAAVSVPKKPTTIKMRETTVRFGTESRTVPLYDATQTLVVGITRGTINLNVGGVASDTFTAIGSLIPERHPRGKEF